MSVAQGIQVESSKEHDGVVKIVLSLQEDLSGKVILHHNAVICAAKTGKQSVRDGEEWHVLNIRIVLGSVRHDMMDVMVVFPPA